MPTPKSDEPTRSTPISSSPQDRNGVLVIVKQIELPSSGSVPNEERQRMLSTLEQFIELVRGLQHDNVMKYLDHSSDETYFRIFCEYVPGGSLATLLKNYDAFEEALARNFVRQILKGLDYLHERGIAHREIKCENILVDEKGRIIISCFGLSKSTDDTGTDAQHPLLEGSEVYWMAPETVRETFCTIKSDIWGVGCSMIEMLTREHPWAQLTELQAALNIGSSAKPAIPSSISADAKDFLNKTFEPNYTIRISASEALLHRWILQT